MRKPRNRIYTVAGIVDGTNFAILSMPEVATCELNLHQETAGLRMFFVDPLSRRKGRGTALFKEAMEFLREAGISSVAWTTTKSNAAGIAFWKSVGAVRFYETGDDWWFAYSL